MQFDHFAIITFRCNRGNEDSRFFPPKKNAKNIISSILILIYSVGDFSLGRPRKGRISKGRRVLCAEVPKYISDFYYSFVFVNHPRGAPKQRLKT